MGQTESLERPTSPRTTPQRGAFRVDLSRVPADVFSLVFIHGAAVDPYFPARISLVCRSWRLLILDTPRAWTHINIGGNASLGYIRTQLRNSKACPLSVTFSDGGGVPSPERNALYEEVIIQKLQIWGSATLLVPSIPYGLFMNAPFNLSSLRHLVLYHVDSPEEAEPLKFASAPASLTSVEIDGCPLHLFADPLRNAHPPLTRLILRHTQSPKLAGLLSLIESFPTLQELYITHQVIGNADARGQRQHRLVHLPHLRVLELESVNDITGLLQHLSLPALSDLSIRDITADCTPICSLLPRPPLRRLRLVRILLSEVLLTRWIQRFPFIEYLTLGCMNISNTLFNSFIVPSANPLSCVAPRLRVLVLNDLDIRGTILSQLITSRLHFVNHWVPDTRGRQGSTPDCPISRIRWVVISNCPGVQQDLRTLSRFTFVDEEHKLLLEAGGKRGRRKMEVLKDESGIIGVFPDSPYLAGGQADDDDGDGS